MMKDIKNLVEKIKKNAISAVDYATSHRILLLFIILGFAIGFALYKTGTYIDVERDNQRYTEETAKIKYNKIDKNILDSFSNKQTDSNVEVNSKYDPNRNNPFIN